MIVKFSPVDPKKPYFKPTQGSAASAGYDIFASETTYVAKETPCLVPTNLKLEFGSYDNYGVYCRIAPRSGLALKGIDVMAGVVDSDYRGEVKAVLIALGEKGHVFNAGDKIAQLIFQPFFRASFVEAESLSETARGEGGFGSTGA